MSQIKVELQEIMGNDRLIAEAAWTSSLDYQRKEARTDDDVKRVVEMLATAKHSVPFESVVLRFWMRIPIAIDRQLMTHRIASHSGMSGRYRTMPNEYLNIPEDCANIIEKLSPKKLDPIYEYHDHCDKANAYYQIMMADFKAAKDAGEITNAEYKRLREFWRGILPQHNMTERVTVINLRSLANFLKLRLKPDAQPEIQYVAKLMLEQLKTKNVAPIAIEWLEKNDWNI